MSRRRLVVGITGASGAIYGVRVLEALRAAGIESHLVLSRAAQLTIADELAREVAEVRALADVAYAIGDVGAAIASGSFRTEGMIVAPCSAQSLAAIATGAGDNLLTRAADVTLKERRRLVLMVRETPLHLGHLRNMTAVTEMGGVIFPPLPAFYHRPQTIDELVSDTVERVIELLGVSTAAPKRWTGL